MSDSKFKGAMIDGKMLFDSSGSDTGWIKPAFLPDGWTSYTGGIRVKSGILFIHFFIQLVSENKAPQIVYPDIAEVLDGYGTQYKLPDGFQLMDYSGYGSSFTPLVWINYSFNGVNSGERGIAIQINANNNPGQWAGVDLSIPLDSIS